MVTLIEEHEFELLGVEALPDAIRGRGSSGITCRSKTCPSPDQRFETRWADARARLRERLRSGERVLVHCRGGLGRAGSVAARLLVEFGAEPGEAIRQVRAVRPGAIETREQERWVEAQRAVERARRPRAAHASSACLLGGAIGDAFGYRVEFNSLAAIRRPSTGRQGIRLAEAEGPLGVSDDTQMTLFTLEGMLRRDTRAGYRSLESSPAGVPRLVRGRSGAVAGTGRPRRPGGLLRTRVLWRRRAPGTTCLSALGAGGQGSADQPINDRKGCGGVMRTAPLGFLRRVWGRRCVRPRGGGRGADPRASGRLGARRGDGAGRSEAAYPCVVERGDRGGACGARRAPARLLARAGYSVRWRARWERVPRAPLPGGGSFGRGWGRG